MCCSARTNDDEPIEYIGPHLVKLSPSNRTYHYWQFLFLIMDYLMAISQPTCTLKQQLRTQPLRKSPLGGRCTESFAHRFDIVESIHLQIILSRSADSQH